jgi:hypothetical protein
VPAFSGVLTRLGVSTSVPSDDDLDSALSLITVGRGGDVPPARLGINVIPVSSVSVSDINGLGCSDSTAEGGAFTSGIGVPYLSNA